MTLTDIGIYGGMLIGAWSIGFSAGLLMTYFKRGIDSIT